MKSSGVIASMPSRPPDSRVIGSGSGRLCGTGDFVLEVLEPDEPRLRCETTRGA